MAQLTPEEATDIAAGAFLFGYPLVLMDVTRAVALNKDGPSGRASLNTLSHLRSFPDASFREVVSPNADTLYSIAWLDLTSEPIVLGLPESGGRYHLMPLLSAWTDVFASPGTRTTGDRGGAFAIAGPRWRGELPAGVREIRSPTAMAWLIGRTQTNGSADYESVRRFQDALSLVPLSSWGKEYVPPPPPAPDPRVDLVTPPPEQVRAMDPDAYFTRLAELMVENPPARADRAALERFAAIGLSPGSFEPDPALASAIADGARAGMSSLVDASARAGAQRGWTLHTGLGSYGVDYAKRAFVAMFGLGANLDEDAVYPHTSVDADGEPLSGEHSYALVFERGRTPPAQAFWSLTMYDEQQYFVENRLDRYAIGDRDPLRFGADGSLEIRLQHESPGAGREANWLPAPAGRFNLILRIYWPEQSVLDARWAPPPVERLV